MRRFTVSALLVAGLLTFAAACILNPQPFPPQSTDFGGTEPDASSDTAAPPMGGDAGADATATAPDAGVGDASVDDGGDGSLDATTDASTDAGGDAESDATGD
ncbi:MAG TPA: hypothetical protein VF316_10815 [Polyangiaceae bacterium]